MNSFFCISLDFEKKWGILDKDLTDYDKNILNVPLVVEKLLILFEQFNINTSWAFVGALLIEDKNQLDTIINNCDYLTYEDNALNPKNYFTKQGYDKKLFCAVDEIITISKIPRHELISHSFFHTYFNENGLKNDALKKDCELFDSFAGKAISLHNKGMIFPRNQVPEHQEPVNNYDYYRSNLDNYFDKGYSESELGFFIKLARFSDCFIPLRKNRCCKPFIDANGKLSIPATRFLRSSYKYSVLNKLQLRRIKGEMLWAAKNNNYYHLWWHPHNFGSNISENLTLLGEILEYYNFLNREYNMQSANMGEIYNNLMRQNKD